MGTNYYKKFPVSDEIKNTLKEKIDNEEFEIDEYGDIKFVNIYDLQLEQKQNLIHIGKRSGGWKFLISSNDWKYYKRDEKDIIEWILKDDGSIIVDEYGEKYTPQAMMEIINETYDTPWQDGKERWDAVSYNKEYPSQFNGIDREYYVGKYRITDGYFC